MANLAKQFQLEEEIITVVHDIEKGECNQVVKHDRLGLLLAQYAKTFPRGKHSVETFRKKGIAHCGSKWRFYFALGVHHYFKGKAVAFKGTVRALENLITHDKKERPDRYPYTKRSPKPPRIAQDRPNGEAIESAGVVVGAIAFEGSELLLNPRATENELPDNGKPHDENVIDVAFTVPDPPVVEPSPQEEIAAFADTHSDTEVGHDDEDDIDRANSMLDAALATIKGLVFDDPWEALLEVVGILGLDWNEVAAWAQRQAEWGADSDEPVDAKRTTAAPVVVATPEAVAATEPEHVERGQPAATVAESIASEPTAEEQSGSGSTPPPPTTDETQPVATNSECPNHYDSLDGDGACAECGRFDPPPPKKSKGTMAKKTPKPKAAKKTTKAAQKEQDDLAPMVATVLERNPSGLRLDQIAAKVLNKGYKTVGQNLTQAVYYNALVPLMKNGKVVKDKDTKKYSLAKPQTVMA